MMIRQPLLIGIHLLITSQISYSLVLLSANIEDVKRLAMQFVPEPLAEQIASLLSKATFIKSPSGSGETIRNGLGKLSYVNWNDAEERGMWDTSEEEKYKNHISVKRGRDTPTKATEETTRATISDIKRNYVYDYALKQGNTKKPNFEWQKGANYDIAVLTNQPPVYDTKATTNSWLKISGVSKKPVNTYDRKPKEPSYPLQALQKTEDVHRPTKEQYKNFIKIRKPPKKDTYSNAQALKPAREGSHKIVIKQIRNPLKENSRYKEGLNKPTKLGIKVKVRKPFKEDTKEQSKEEIIVESDSDDSNVNKIEIDEDSSGSYRMDESAEPVGSTRFVDYERANTIKYQSEKSIYTKDVVATSGPVELLRASVNFVVSSEENSLNEENKKYFKQYDNVANTDVRRKLEDKSADAETTTTTAMTEEAKTQTEAEVKEVTTVGTEGTDAKADAEKNTKSSWYGGATVYNNVQTEQVTEDVTKDKSN